MNENWCSDRDLASMIESWPIAICVLRQDREVAGGWALLALNLLARQRFGWSKGRQGNLYDWLRAAGESRRLQSWLDDQVADEIRTANGIYRLFRFADGCVGIACGDLHEAMKPQEICQAGGTILDKGCDDTLLICDDQGCVLGFWSDRSQDWADDKPLFLDQVLQVARVEEAYDLLDGLQHEPTIRHERACGTRIHAGLNMLTFRSEDLPALAETDPIHAAIVRGLDGHLLAIGPDGSITSSSREADRFWDRDLRHCHVDDVLKLEGQEGTGFWASFAEKCQASDMALRTWAKLNTKLARVQIKRRDISHQGQVLTLLRIEPVHEPRGAELTIHNLAHFDPLTGLPNRQLFGDRLANAIEHARRYHQILTVMVVDVDRFKLINDSLGLDMGDVAIKAITLRISSVLSDGDTIARSGADEFLLMCFAQTSAEDAARLAKSIHAAFRQPVTIGPHDISVSVSIGIAMFPHDGDQPTDLLRNADAALGRAKAQGRNISQFFTDDMNATAFERLMLENRLRKALQNKEIRVYYQPQVRIDSGKIVGVEALIRWFHPELGVVSPAEFIPLAEETGLIIAIGLWALEEACRQVKVWHRQGHDELRLAVNLSALQFEQEDLIDQIKSVLASTDLPVSCLELELTEGVVMRNAEATVHRLQSLRDLGVSLAVDDFGTGYSSLAYLKRFPLRSLKIDRSFVGDIDRDANSLAIVQAIIALGNSLGIKLVAEGVETEQQLDELRQLDCEEMQGYLFSRPLPPDDLAKLLENHNRLKLTT